MKSIFHRETKPLSSFEKAVLTVVEENYLGLLIPGDVNPETLPNGWFHYYVQGSKNTITVLSSPPSHRFIGTLLLEHPYELKGFFKKKTLPSTDWAPIEGVEIEKYLEMPSPATLTYEEMVAYGYHWDGMYPLTLQDIKNILNSPSDVADTPFYILNPDNTETLLESSDDIPEDAENRIFGIQ